MGPTEGPSPREPEDEASPRAALWVPGSLDPARDLQPRPPGHLLPEPARPALTSRA